LAQFQSHQKEGRRNDYLNEKSQVLYEDRFRVREIPLARSKTISNHVVLDQRFSKWFPAQMANRAYFYCSQTDAFPTTEANASLASDYQIPLLWLSLFTVSNITPTEIEFEDSNGQPITSTMPQLTVSRDAGVERSESRRNFILSMLPTSLHIHVHEWFQFLLAQDCSFFHVDLSEIWCLFQPGEFDLHLINLLQSFESSNPEESRELLAEAWIDSLGQEADNDTNVARYGLRGYSWA